MATLTICDRCGTQRPTNQRNWYEMTFTDNNRNPAEPKFVYDLCNECAEQLAAQEDWLFR